MGVDREVIGAELVGGSGLLRERLTSWGYYGLADNNLFDAVAAYQKAYAVEIDRLSAGFHGSKAKADGKIGPATAQVMNSRHCNVSDFADVSRARWPDTCVNDLTVSWSFANFPGASEAETLEAWNSLSTFSRLFVLKLVLTRDAFPNTRIRASLRRLPGSTLAWSELPNGNCSASLEQAYDSTISWSSRYLRIGTIRHEVGHALDLRHTPSDPDSVMYPSMRGQYELNATDIRQMLSRGYKRRADPSPPPSPPGRKVSAVVTVDGVRYSLVDEHDGMGGWWP